MSDYHGDKRERGGLRISLSVFPADPLRRDPVEPHKLRLTIFSADDFRSPHHESGRLFRDRRSAEEARVETCKALDALGFGDVEAVQQLRVLGAGQNYSQ